MKTKRAVKITICMGSSCFARGNGDNLAFIEKYAADAGLKAEVTLAGSRCEGRCADGPNIVINGRAYGGVQQAQLCELLDDLCAVRGEE